MTLEQQVVTLFIIFLSAFLIGAVFDGYRVLKGKIVLPKWTVFIIDVLFGIFAAFLVFFLLLWSNNGQLRVIIYFIFFLGLWTYYQTLSRYIIRWWSIVFYIIYRIWRLLTEGVKFFIIKPIVWLYQLIIAVIAIFIGLFSSIFNILKRIFYRIFYPLGKGIWGKAKGTGKKAKKKLMKKEGFFSLVKKMLKRRK